jgi:hypothetical protein
MPGIGYSFMLSDTLWRGGGAMQRQTGSLHTLSAVSSRTAARIQPKSRPSLAHTRTLWFSLLDDVPFFVARLLSISPFVRHCTTTRTRQTRSIRLCLLPPQREEGLQKKREECENERGRERQDEATEVCVETAEGQPGGCGCQRATGPFARTQASGELPGTRQAHLRRATRGLPSLPRHHALLQGAEVRP